MIRPDWRRCIVAAPGPSLLGLRLQAEGRQRQGWRIIAVNDAWRLLPLADVLYVCDRAWWDYHGAALGDFFGERWTSNHSLPSTPDQIVDDDKLAWGRAGELGLHLINACHGVGFSFTPGQIHYGQNAGFQAVNLALQFGAKEVRLAGFDMRMVGGRKNYYGEQPPSLRTGSDYQVFIAEFRQAAALLPPDIHIANCTPDSALDCFPREAL